MLLARTGSTRSNALICESFSFFSPHSIHLILCDNSGKMNKPALANLCTTFGLKCTWEMLFESTKMCATHTVPLVAIQCQTESRRAETLAWVSSLLRFHTQKFKLLIINIL